MIRLSTIEITVIRARILRGDRYHDIAADYRVDQGRLSDVEHGPIFPTIVPARL